MRDFGRLPDLTVGMIFWLLVLILLASLTALGYRQGGIRVAMSFLGIVFGVLLAGPLSALTAPLLKLVGVKNPFFLWILPPFVAFCAVNAVFKIAAAFIHRKVEVYYKYKAGDLRLALWHRLMARLGLCVGLLNGVAYLVLISMVIYGLGYWTVQVGAPAEAKWPVKILNRLAWGMDSSGFVKTARSVDPFPESYYKAADVAGLVYQNSGLDARLKSYPQFLILGESPAFQKLAEDTEFNDMLARQAPVNQVFANPSVEAILTDPNVIGEIWSTVEPTLDDLQEYLKTGISPIYSTERLYGRWRLNPSASAASLRKERPKISSREMKRTRQILAYSYGQASLIVGTDGRLVAKNFSGTPVDPNQPAPAPNTTSGDWRESGDDYRLIFNTDGQEMRLKAVVQGERLTVTGFDLPLVFDRES